MAILKGDIEVVALSSLTLHPENVRNHLTKAIVRESLETHGQYVPLLVQKSTGYVVKGNGTLEVMRELKWRKCEIRRINVSDAQARQILVVDNHSSDGSTDDPEALASLLQRIDKDKGLVGTGYSNLEVANLLHRIDEPEAASAFLDRFIDTGDGDEPPAAVSQPDGSTLFRISYLVSGDDRAMINGRIRNVKETYGLESSSEAITTIVKAYGNGS